MKRAAIALTLIALILPVCAIAAEEGEEAGMTAKAFKGL